MKEEMEELVGAVEYVPIENGANIEIPDAMWTNITRGREGWNDDGYLKIKSLGNDTYKISKMKRDEIPISNIEIPDMLKRQIQRHIDDDAIIREFGYTSVQDFIYRSIDDIIKSEKEQCQINKMKC